MKYETFYSNKRELERVMRCKVKLLGRLDDGASSSNMELLRGHFVTISRVYLHECRVDGYAVAIEDLPSIFKSLDAYAKLCKQSAKKLYADGTFKPPTMNAAERAQRRAVERKREVQRVRWRARQRKAQR